MMETAGFLLLGALVAFGIPHLGQGMSGRRFPTPASLLTGRDSAPLTNTALGLALLLAAALLYHAGLQVDRAAGERIPMGTVTLGFAAAALAESWVHGRRLLVRNED
ncbi:MAG: hypothetical protein WBG08_01625 [Litorimonas sp.]